MISVMNGTLSAVRDSGIEISLGPVTFDVLVPSIDLPGYGGRVGSTLTLYTLMYLEGDASRGNVEPRVIGFSSRIDKAFFELFTTVKGIGPKTALRALTEPIQTIAGWIETRDARSLTRLSGIGKRTAELVVAELSGKCGRFAGVAPGPDNKVARPVPNRPPEQEDALAALVSLGERRADAEALLDRALINTDRVDTNLLVREMLRLRTAR
jgi:holliday junction DNA helicase RuvA